MWAAPWAAGPARNLLHCGLLSMGCIFLHGTSSCSGTWSSVGYSVDVCSIMVLHKLQVNDFFHNDLCPGLLGNPCKHRHLKHLLPHLHRPGFLQGYFFLLSFFPSSPSQLLCGIFTPSEACYHRVVTNISDGLSFGQGQLHFWMVASNTGESPCLFFQGLPLSSPTTKTDPCKPNKIYH